MFSDVEAKDYLKLFEHKVAECKKLCDFEKPEKDEKAKVTKTQLLRHLKEGFANANVVKALTPAAIADCYSMILANIERRLPMCPIWGPLDVKDCVLDEAWPHLALVYELIDAVTSSQQAQSQLPPALITVLVKNATSLDDRERAAARDAWVKLYTKFVGKRASMRAELGHMMGLGYGSAEIIDVFKHCVAGFNSPLKAEHVKFVREHIFPLFWHNDFWQWPDSYAELLTKLIEKQPDLFLEALAYADKHYPVSERRKQDSYRRVVLALVKQNGSLVTENHMKYVWRIMNNNIFNEHEQICNEGLNFVIDNDIVPLTVKWSENSIPAIWESLGKATRHWADTCSGFARRVLSDVKAMDPDIVDKLSDKEAARARKRARSKAKKVFKETWMLIFESAKANDPSIKAINFEGMH